MTWIKISKLGHSSQHCDNLYHHKTNEYVSKEKQNAKKIIHISKNEKQRHQAYHF